MKKFYALILAGSLVLAGCSQKQTLSEQAVYTEEPPAVVEQQAPVAEEVSNVEPEVVVEQKAAIKRGADKIFFDLNSHVLTAASRQALEDNALWLKSQPEVRLVIEGHADERGPAKYNLVLGEKRAKATRDYLVTLGIAPERITIISYGKEKATRGSGNEAVWALDRRAEFVTAD